MHAFSRRSRPPSPLRNVSLCPPLLVAASPPTLPPLCSRVRSHLGGRWRRRTRSALSLSFFNVKNADEKKKRPTSDERFLLRSLQTARQRRTNTRALASTSRMFALIRDDAKICERFFVFFLDARWSAARFFVFAAVHMAPPASAVSARAPVRECLLTSSTMTRAKSARRHANSRRLSGAQNARELLRQRRTRGRQK